VDFEITHTTRYTYGQPAAEAYGEARLTPPDLPSQKVLSHRLVIDPPVETSSYVDYHGNKVCFFSLPFRHHSLKVLNYAVVRTELQALPQESLQLSVQEARQIFASVLPDVFDYLRPTSAVPIGSDSLQWAKRHFRGATPVGEGVERLIGGIFSEFKYVKGATENTTALAEIWKNRKGVCQDFAHVALSILRTAGLPARYVCGYIETDPPFNGRTDATDAGNPGTEGTALVGAVATHAWVEVLLPGMVWAGIDPTNNQWVNERYVAVSYGRDFRDATPLRGTFKGSSSQEMEVEVVMKRCAPIL
jgi:transglutaminase-like putative cysteine protease